MMSRKRLDREIHENRMSMPPGVMSILLVEDKIENWDVTIIGPQDTPYEGGKFIVNIDFSYNYPFAAPRTQFKTKIYHPSVDQNTGSICQDALGVKDIWVPTKNGRTVIQYLIDFMKYPMDGHNCWSDIAQLCSNNYEKFYATARDYNFKYAY